MNESSAVVQVPHLPLSSSAGNKHKHIRVFVFEYLKIWSVCVCFVFVVFGFPNTKIWGYLWHLEWLQNCLYLEHLGVKFPRCRHQSDEKQSKTPQKHQFISKKNPTCLRCLHANMYLYLECLQWKKIEVFGCVCRCAVKCLEVFV